MESKRIDLYEYFGLQKPQGAKGFLDVYLQRDSIEYPNFFHPAMLVIPGGGYQFVSDREKDLIAMSYYVEGFNAYSLDYSVKPISYPYQLLEACLAMLYIRENAKEQLTLTDKVACIGFSAGGHLAGMLSNICDEKEIKDILGKKVNDCKPNACILSYPVITTGEYTHEGTKNVITNGDKDLIKRLSLENRVNKKSCPAFIWTTANDNCVPSENSLLIAMAYKKAGVPFELHVFENGIHGLSLSKEATQHVNKEVSRWYKLSVSWLKNRDFTPKYIK